MGYKKLEELQEKDANAIVLTFDKYKTAFQKAVDETNYSSNNWRKYILLLRCMAKCCECESLRQQIIDIFTVVERSSFFDEVEGFILSIVNIRTPRQQLQFQQPLRDIFTIFLKMKVMLPKSRIKIQGLLSFIDTPINVLKSDTTILDDDMWEMYENLTRRGNERRPVRNVHQENNQYDDEDEPDGDFREFPLFPTMEEVQSANPPLLRRNKVFGGYRNLEHYLDVQYRLLREDFVAPLRDGIKNYIEAIHSHGQNTNKKLNELRIYRDVQIISPICNYHGLCRRVSFTYPGMHKIRWEQSKHLIYGSLVCLSADNFQTVWFATVANRDLKIVQKGLVDLKFEKDYEEISQISPDTVFVMAETTAYFEAYKHVLTGLQHMQAGDFPFEDYIVRCLSDVKEPAYLQRIPNMTYDLRPLVDENIKLDDRKVENNYTFTDASEEAMNINVKDRASWPTSICDLLHLDTSQLKALEAALSKEFVVIQGPPGTGKTYIGLKIVRALLHNRHIWSINPDTGTEEKRPMLVVCYTNHALDQFLEGVVLCYSGSVLRLGSRSSSEILKPLSIYNKRMTMRDNRQIPLEIHSSKMDVKHSIISLQVDVNKIADRIEKAKREILHEDAIKHVMGNLYDQIKSGYESIMYDFYGEDTKREMLAKQSAVLEWLGFGEFLGFEPDFEGGSEKESKPPGSEENQEGNEDQRKENAYREEAERRPQDFVNVHDENDVEIAQRRGAVDDSDTDDETFEDRLEKILRENIPLVALDVSELDLLLRRPKEEGMRWQKPKKKNKALKKKIRQKLSSKDRMTEEEVENFPYFVWDLDPDERWRMYRYWVKVYCDDLQEKIKDKEIEYENICKKYHEIIMQEDKTIMQSSTIIGLTTTCAAKYQSVLQEIGPRIIIVEEAAEVLEAHVITTLSRRCEHLILIGDHKQLKPKPTVYKLAKDYNLDLSLFERMANNKIEPKCLSLQHRMRPEISDMMTIIYPDLLDHDVVKTYDRVRGISKDVYFIDHVEPETPEKDIRSHSNKHEADYIVQLCRYLLLQGYSPSQITVLATYSGQLYELKYRMPKAEFEGVRVTVVDNYQGEENDIILLSLVRSNPDGTLGFIKEENRICVAMSRAKIGLYVIGNFEMLSAKSEMWRRFVDYARKKRFIGKKLRLICENHPNSPESTIDAEYPSDFERSPGGGCKRPCEFRLRCGHTCPMVCHHTDLKHEEVICTKPCTKTCVRNHKCTRKCNQKCSKCEVKVEKCLPKCRHTQMVPCFYDPIDFKCEAKCDKTLPCGHKCEKQCGEKHTEDCNVHVEKQGQCSHTSSIPCHKKRKEPNFCPEVCKEVLECGHGCKGSCGECLNGRLHKRCEEPCKKVLVCEHICREKCNNCPPCKEKCSNRCIHNYCGKQCGEECDFCAEDCEWRCEHFRCDKICSSPCDRPRCSQPCKKFLPDCGHKCIGLCGEPCPKICRVCDPESEAFTLFFGNEEDEHARFVQLEDCSHILEVEGLDKWMDEVNDERIRLKECPKCKTPIRKNLRYGNVIKEILHNIEIVKQRMMGSKSNIDDLEKDIQRGLFEIDMADARQLKRIHNDLTTGAKDETTLRTIVEQIKILKYIKDISAKFETNEGRSGRYGEMYKKILSEIEAVRTFALLHRRYFTRQETHDIQNEIERLRLLHKFMRFKERRVVLVKPLDRNQSLDFMVAEQNLTDGRKLTVKKRREVEKTLSTLKEVIPLTGLGISEEERVEILAAMGLTKGHWFKCSMGMCKMHLSFFKIKNKK